MLIETDFNDVSEWIISEYEISVENPPSHDAIDEMISDYEYTNQIAVPVSIRNKVKKDLGSVTLH